MVCIDDFALKKREKYGTVMIDIETGNVVDMLESREYEDVKVWLESFPNIQIFSRDGSITYSKAMRDSHTEAIQISDRFHLLKNLTDYCKDYIKRTIKNKIEIRPTVEIVTDNINIKSTLSIKSEAIRKNKECLISEAKNHKIQGYSMRKIADIMGLDRKTVKKYIESDGTYEHASKGNTRVGKLTNFQNKITEMYAQGSTIIAIIAEIRKDGYTGSDSLVRNYISKINCRSVSTNNVTSEHISRKHLISLLYKEIDKIKFITTKQLQMIFDIHPQLVTVYDVLRDFKELLFSKDVYRLDKWINQVSDMNIPELNSFINGITRDIDAVRNAVVYEYNNGLAEGTVNKIKVIKRIMYGRCGFDMLKRKVIYANFN